MGAALANEPLDRPNGVVGLDKAAHDCKDAWLIKPFAHYRW